VLKAHRRWVSLNSRLESNKEKEKRNQSTSIVPSRIEGSSKEEILDQPA